MTTTRTIDIPRARWPAFLKMVNQLAAGEPVRIEVVNRELGDQEMEKSLALRDLEIETKGSERGQLIIAVESDHGDLTHLVQQPQRMAAGINEAAELQWLAIEEENEAVTTLHFEHFTALAPEYTSTP